MPSYLHVNGFQDSVVASGTTVKYPHISGGGAAAPTAFANSQALSRADYTWKLLQGRVITNTSTLTCTLASYKNGAAGTQTLSWTAAQTGQKQDTTHTDTIASGDLINYQETYNLGASQQVAFIPVGSILQCGGPLTIQSGDGNFALDPSNSLFPLGGTALPTSVELNVHMVFWVEGYITFFRARLSSNTTTVTTTIRPRMVYAGDSATYDSDLNVAWTAATSGSLEDTSNYDYMTVGGAISFALSAGGTGGSAVLTEWQVESGLDGLQLGGGSRPTSAPQTVYWPLGGIANGTGLTVESQAQAVASVPSLFGNFQVKMSDTTGITVPTTIELRVNSLSVGPSIQAGPFSNGYFLDSTTVLNLAGTEQLNLRVTSVGGGGSASFMAWVQSPYTPAPGAISPGTATLSLATFPPAVRLGWTKVQQQQATGSSTTAAATFPAPPTTGNLLLAFVSGATATVPTAVTSGWNALTSSSASGGQARASRLFWKIAGASEPSLHQFTVGSSNWICFLVEWNGNDPAPLLVENAVANASGTNTTPSVTPASAVGALAIVGWLYRTIPLTQSGQTVGGVAAIEMADQAAAATIAQAWASRIIAATSGSYAGATTPSAAAVNDGHIALFKRLAGAVSVTPGATALVLTRFVPLVGAPRAVVPGTKALVTARFAPTVQLGLRVVPGTGALVTARFAPLVGAPRLSTPGTAALLTARFAPTVKTGVTVVPGTKALQLVTFAPTAAIPRNVVPGTAALVTARFVPLVGAPRAAMPATATLLTTRFAPTVVVSIGSAIGTAFLVLIAYPPRVTTPRALVPGTAALVLTSFVPSVRTPRVATPSSAALFLTSFAPLVLTPSRVTPGTAALILASFAPLVLTPTRAMPNTTALLLIRFAPLVSVSHHEAIPEILYLRGGEGLVRLNGAFGAPLALPSDTGAITLGG